MTREPIYAALFALVSNAAGFTRKGRKLPPWSNVSAGDSPAIFVLQTGETPNQRTNMPASWKLNVDIYIYARSSDNSVAPSQIINPLVDAVVNALVPTNAENQTLGGLVQYCRISGQIVTDEGTLGDHAVAIIPVELLTT